MKMTMKLTKSRKGKKKYNQSLLSNKNKSKVRFLLKILIYDDFSEKCHVIIKKFLLLFETFLSYLVCVPSFKSINTSSLLSKTYGVLFIRLWGIRNSWATIDLICPLRNVDQYIFQHYVIDYIVKAMKVFHMRYRLQTWCFA